MQRAVAIWFPVAAIIVVAALASVVALADGRLSETDGRIIFSGVAALLCGGAAIAAVELIERRQLRLLAWLALAGALVEFTIVELGIWTFREETANRYVRWAWTATAWLVPTIVIPTYALLVREGRLARWACSSCLPVSSPSPVCRRRSSGRTADTTRRAA